MLSSSTSTATHWWKTKILTFLLLAYYVGGIVSEFINDAIPGKLAYVSGGISLATGCAAGLHSLLTGSVSAVTWTTILGVVN